MNKEQILQNIAVLEDDILHIEAQIERLNPDSIEAESKERIVNVKWRLLQEQRAALSMVSA